MNYNSKNSTELAAPELMFDYFFQLPPGVLLRRHAKHVLNHNKRQGFLSDVSAPQRHLRLC
jgi:hypothetical protein